MYNLIMGAVDGELGSDRLLEVVDAGLDSYVRPGGRIDFNQLMALPTLLMPERLDSSRTQVAQVGRVASIQLAGRVYRFRFVPNSAIPAMPSSRIEALAIRLGITQWDFARTRWSVKSPDLYEALLEDGLSRPPRPTAFTLPDGPPESDLIAVMMPFGAEFAPVWQTLRNLGTANGWRVQRADDIWEHSVLIDDIVSLIARAKVVICDLSGRNPNVFYETGIAHALGREVVMITKSADDVPFDLRHHRFVSYLDNAEGRSALQDTVLTRLRKLMSE